MRWRLMRRWRSRLCAHRIQFGFRRSEQRLAQAFPMDTFRFIDLNDTVEITSEFQQEKFVGGRIPFCRGRPIDGVFMEADQGVHPYKGSRKAHGVSLELLPPLCVAQVRAAGGQRSFPSTVQVVEEQALVLDK